MGDCIFVHCNAAFNTLRFGKKIMKLYKKVNNLKILLTFKNVLI